jgi:thioredoxin-related protein
MHGFVLAVCLVCSVAILSAGDGVTFTTIRSWNEALALSKSTGKPIFLDAYTDWCGWCKVMDKETFSDAKVAEVMNASFVCVKMEMETGEGVDVAMKYRVSSYPTFMFFTPDGMPTFRVSGYEPPEKWLVSLADAKDPAKRLKAPGVTPELKLNFPDWHRISFLKGSSRKFPDTAVSRAWFESYQNKYDEVAWGVLLRQDLGETWEQWALAHESEYASRYGDEVDQLHNKLANRYFMRAVQKKDPKWIESAVNVAKTGSADEKAYLLLRYTGLYGQRVKEWDVVGRVAKDMADRPDFTNYTNDINEFSWSIYEKGEGADALNNAIYAMGKITKDPSAEWAHLDTYAALLYKAGRIKDAQVAAERAIEGGKASGADVKETEALLEKIKAGK